jgi:N-methylhydantoinase B/oxoprolinase/acetone carboxylase alpha subunit
MRHSAPGLLGGLDGPLTEILIDGRQIAVDDLQAGQVVLAADESRLEMRIPGGAGYGPPERRDPALIEADECSGLVTQPGRAATSVG